MRISATPKPVPATAARFDSLQGEGVTNAYDGFGRLAWTNVSQSRASRTLSFAYHADGSRERIVHPDGRHSAISMTRSDG